MKVVLFCGGYGMRMRGGPEDLVPKPMQLVGPYPLLHHVMRYYAHFGHTEFVLCLGYGAAAIRSYFEEPSGHRQDPSAAGWDVQLVDTGLDSPIGERLRRVAPLLTGEHFLANYADVLCDAPLDDMVQRLQSRPEQVGSMIAVRPQESFHVLAFDSEHRVSGFTSVSDLPLWENGGYFVFRREVLDALTPGCDLVADVCGRLAAEGRLLAYPYDGFWKPADTFKERAALDELWRDGARPWAVWEREPSPTAATPRVLAETAGAVS